MSLSSFSDSKVGKVSGKDDGAMKPAGRGQWQSSRSGSGSKENYQMLTNNVLVHVWLEGAGRRIAVGDKAKWTCLFESSRCLPEPVSYKERVALILKSATSQDDDEDLEDFELNDEENAEVQALREQAAAIEGSSVGGSKAQRKTYRDQIQGLDDALEQIVERARLREKVRRVEAERSAKRAMQDMARSVAMKHYAAQLEEIHSQNEEIFVDLWNHIEVKIQDRIKTKTEWASCKSSRDVLCLLRLVERCHGVFVDSNDDNARMLAEDVIVSLKQRSGSDLSSFKDEVLAAYRVRARYSQAGEPAVTESAMIARFIKGLSSAHSRYKHFYVNLKVEDRPGTLDSLVQAIEEFEQDHLIISKSEFKHGVKSTSQLAIYDVQEKKKKEHTKGAPAARKGACRKCGQAGHWERECPTKDVKQESAKSVSVSVQHRKVGVGSITVAEHADHAEAALQGDASSVEVSEVVVVDYTRNRGAPLGESKPSWVNLDSGAEASVFCNADLLSGVHRGTPKILNTIAGEMKVDLYGMFGPIKVLINPGGDVNLLSLHDLELVSSRMSFEPGVQVCSTLRDSSEQWVFKKLEHGEFGGKNVFYVFIPNMHSMYVTTVAERESKYTKDELARARGVRELKIHLGGASDVDLIKFINSGVAIGCPYTAMDVRRSAMIYGPDIAGLKGKTTASGPKRATIIEVDRVGESIKQFLFVDVFEVEGQPFILAVMKPLYFRFCAILDGKTAVAIRSALEAIIDMIKSKGFVISRVEIDPERGLFAVKDQLGVDVVVVGAGSHVAVAERGGRVVKERCRLILSSLPYPLAGRFMRYLVMFVVTRLNLMPRAGDGHSECPRERFTGKKIHFKRELEIGFGDFAEVWSKPIQSNSMEPRTISAIALCPVGNDEGSWYFYDLLESTVFQRSQWKVLPMPDIVIKMLKELARQDELKLGKGIQVPMTRGDAMVGEVPVGRMIVDPRLDVPRYDANGELLEVTINPRRNKKRPAVGRAVGDGGESGGGAVVVAAHPEVEEVMVEVGQGGVVVEGEDVPIGGGASESMPVNVEDGLEFPALFDQDKEEIEEELGHVIEDGVRKSSRLAMRGKVRSADFGHVRVMNMTVKEALGKFGEQAEEACMKEFQKVKEFDAVEPIKFDMLNEDEKKRIIHSSLFLKEKVDEHGKLASIKARWFTLGNGMKKELYESGSSPTVSTEGVFVQIALCAGGNKHWCTVDIGSAFMHSDMHEFVAVYIPSGLVPFVVKVNPEYSTFVDKKGRLLVKLKKAINGCIQSSRLWYELMDSVLKEAGYYQNSYDSCMYHKGAVGEQVSVCLHVDDLLITADEKQEMEDLIVHMRKVFKEVKVKEGGLNTYLGMRLRDTADSIEVDMILYIEECLEWCKVAGTAVTPATSDLFEEKEGEVVLGQDEQEDFHTGVAKLLYLAKRCRPDILPAVSHLSSRVKKATAQDVLKLQRVFKFLRGSKDKVMKFRKDVPELELMAYVDAGYGIHKEGESRSGLVVTLNGTPVICKTSKQGIVTKSSTEAELVALSDGCTDILWVRELLMSQGYNVGTVEIGEDNQSVLAMLDKRRFANARTKHINIRYFFVVDRIKNEELKMVYVPTDLMLADYMTKPLTGAQFIALQDKLLGLTPLQKLSGS